MYKDPSLGVDKRVNDLLGKMTIEEKVAQLGSAMLLYLTDNNGLNKNKAKQFLAHGLGEISRTQWMLGDIEPEQCCDLVKEVQDFLINQTRLGIPAIIHEECLTGYQTKRANTYPQSIGIASTWHEDLIYDMADRIRQEMRLVGATHGLSPVLDLARDARWGRVEETYGEDPYLASRFGVSYIQGLQGKDLRQGVMATAKHFIGYGLTEGGLNWSPTHLNEREMKEIYGRTFEAAISEANLAAVMNSYSEIDGIPCGLSKKLLTDLLREHMGFTGIVVADYGAINTAYTYHHATTNIDQAGIRALEAGLDIELPKTDAYGAVLLQALKQKLIDPEYVDTSVARILKKKFELGLFENPYGNKEKINLTFADPASKKLAQDIVRESLVLLHNDGLLPLSKTIGSLAVIGPNAHSLRNLFGDYTYGGHLEGALDMLHSFSLSNGTNANINSILAILTKIYKLDIMTCTYSELQGCYDDQDMQKDANAAFGFDFCKHFSTHALWSIIDNTRMVEYMSNLTNVKKLTQFNDSEAMIRYLYNPQSVFDAIKAKAPQGVKVAYAKGCGINDNDESGFAEAMAVSQQVDIIIAVMGDRSGIDLKSTTGEARDRACLDLCGKQQDLLKELKKTNKPIVLVLINGRPLSLGWEQENMNAIVEAWIPGEHGGVGIADVLFGNFNPGGKLPISFPRSVGQVPVFYNHKPSGGRSHWFGDYVEMSAKPLFPFGFGLSYTEFTYKDLELSQEVESTGEAFISMVITNTGTCDGHDIVQLYIHDKEASITRPVKQLYGYQKVFLKKGESAKLCFTVPMDILGFYDHNMDFVVEPGTMEVMIGASSEDIRLKSSFEIKGEKRIIENKKFFSSCQVETV